jgi:hypothetical protein
MPKSAKQFFRRGAQIDRSGVPVQCMAIGIAQHHPTTRGQHTAVSTHEIGDHFLLDIAKALFALSIEELADAAADLPFDDRIAVTEGHTQPPCQIPPDSRFAATGHADQANEHDALQTG